MRQMTLVYELFMNTLTKKAIGTTAVLGVSSMAILGLTTDVFAQFIDVNKNVIADGVVMAESDNTVTVATSGSEPLVFAINNKTVVNGDDKAVDVGDGIRAIGQRHGNELVAKVLQMSNDESVGYGRPGDGAISLKGEVAAVGSDSFTIETTNATTTYAVNESTLFVRGSLDQLEVGDKVHVIGMDAGNSFVARVVISGK